MSLLDVAIAVGRAALHGHKNRAGPHLARVVLDARHRLAGVSARVNRRYFRNQFIPVHHGFHCRCTGKAPALQSVRPSPQQAALTKQHLALLWKQTTVHRGGAGDKRRQSFHISCGLRVSYLCSVARHLL
jgi:hypothetical protein